MESTYDTYCKKVLSHKWLLAKMLKEFIEEYKNCTLEEIKGFITEPQSDSIDGNYLETRNVEDLTHGEVRFDVLLYAKLPDSEEKIGLMINLEVQGKNPGYPITKRALFYLATLIVRQKGHPNGFRKAEYGKLKKVVGIWIYQHNKSTQGMVNEYKIEEKMLGQEYRIKKEDYDLMEMVIVSPKEKVGHEDEMMDILSLLFTSKGKLSTDTIYQLRKEYDIVMTEEEREEIEEMCNWSEYRLQQGREEGIILGRNEGLIEGEKNKANQIAKNLLGMSLPLEMIVQATGLSLETLLQMKKELELVVS